MIFKTTRLPADACPTCGEKLDAATSAQGNYNPEEDDVSVCGYCATVLQFDEKLRLHAMTQAEIEALEPDVAAELMHAVAVVLAIQQQNDK